jgi:hypothetical protein
VSGYGFEVREGDFVAREAVIGYVFCLGVGAVVEEDASADEATSFVPV